MNAWGEAFGIVGLLFWLVLLFVVPFVLARRVQSALMASALAAFVIVFAINLPVIVYLGAPDVVPFWSAMLKRLPDVF